MEAKVGKSSKYDDKYVKSDKRPVFEIQAGCTANFLTIETMDFNHVPNPTKILAKTIETVVITLDYLDLKT